MEALDEVADECRKAGSPDVLVAPHDLAEEQECIKAVQETVEHFGGKRDPSFSWQKSKSEVGDSEMNLYVDIVLKGYNVHLQSSLKLWYIG